MMEALKISCCKSKRVPDLVLRFSESLCHHWIWKKCKSIEGIDSPIFNSQLFFIAVFLDETTMAVNSSASLILVFIAIPI